MEFRRAQQVWGAVRKRPVLVGMAITVAYLLIAVVLTWPLTARLTTHLSGDMGDGWMFTWNLWIFRHALLHGHWPTVTPMLFYPEGGNLLVHSMSWASCLLAFPLLSFMQPLTAYNVLVLFYYVHAAIGMYVLARMVKASRGASFFGGFLFSFSLFHYAHGLGHLNLMGIGWLPLFLAFLIRTIEDPTWKSALRASGSFVAATLTSWYLGAMALEAGLIVWIWLLVRSKNARTKACVLRLVGAAVVAVLLLTPFLWGLIHDLGRGALLGSHNPWNHGADLVAFVVPSRLLFLGKHFSHLIPHHLAVNWAEDTAFVGFVAVALALVGFVSRRRSALTGLFIVGGAGFVLSLGPALRLDGTLHRSFELPFLFLYRWVPLFKIGTVASRHTLLVLLSLSAGAALGLDVLIQKKGWWTWLACGLAFLAVVEHVPAMPMVNTQVRMPGFLETIRKEPGFFTVLDVGPKSFQNYHQIFHRRPIVGGYLARMERRTWEAFTSNVATAVLLRLAPRSTFPSRPKALKQLRERKIRYIIVPMRYKKTRRFIKRALHLSVAYRGGWLIAYRVR